MKRLWLILPVMFFFSCGESEKPTPTLGMELNGGWEGYTSQGFEITIYVANNYTSGPDYEISSIFLECYAETLKLEDTSYCGHGLRCNQGRSIDDCFIVDNEFSGNDVSDERIWTFSGTFVAEDSVAGTLSIRDTLDMCWSGNMEWYAIKDED